jgi:hypothetical protein
VAVQAVAGPVVAPGSAGIGMAGEVLNAPEGDAGVERRGDGAVPEVWGLSRSAAGSWALRASRRTRRQGARFG